MSADSGTMKAAGAAVGKKVDQVAAPRVEHDRGVLGRLLGYMVRAESTGKVAWAIMIEVAAQLALILIPYLSANALNEVSTPGGSQAALAWWSVAGIAAGIVALVLAFFANRLFADWRPRRSTSCRRISLATCRRCRSASSTATRWAT